MLAKNFNMKKQCWILVTLRKVSCLIHFNLQTFKHKFRSNRYSSLKERLCIKFRQLFCSFQILVCYQSWRIFLEPKLYVDLFILLSRGLTVK